MREYWQAWTALMVCVVLGATRRTSEAQAVAALPSGVRAVWDLDKAYRETTPTRERICINGLWRWQPAKAASDKIPSQSIDIALLGTLLPTDCHLSS